MSSTISAFYTEASRRLPLADAALRLPRATVFQAMLGLLLYNITRMIRDHVAVGAGREPEIVSLKLLFDDVVRDLTGWVTVIGVEAGLDLLQATRIRTPADLRRHLRDGLAAAWTDRWVKTPTRKQPPKRPPRAYICGGHTSVDKILRGAHHEIPFEPDQKRAKGRKNMKNPPPFETKKRV